MQTSAAGSSGAQSNPLLTKIDQTTRGQIYHAGKSIEEGGWQLFAEDEAGQMKLYTRELEVDGLVCDPLKAVRVVRGITGFELCHRFFNPDFRFEWEDTLESMKVVEDINKDTLVFHQIHKRIWPAAQRDAVFWSHIRKVEQPKASCLSKDDLSLVTRPDLKLHDTWIVCNDSTDKPDIPLESCVRVKLTVSLLCETYIPVDADPATVTREQLTCKIIYSSTSKYQPPSDASAGPATRVLTVAPPNPVNPGGWAPAALLRAVYKREYPKFLENFSNYVIEATKSSPIVFE